MTIIKTLEQLINLTKDFFSTQQPNASCFIFFGDLHYLKPILVSCINGTFGFARHTSQAFSKPKEHFLPLHLFYGPLNQ